MTTIISQNLTFVAADRLWTDCDDNPAPAPFKKFYVLMIASYSILVI